MKLLKTSKIERALIGKNAMKLQKTRKAGGRSLNAVLLSSAMIAASATIPMAANAAGTEISLVTNGVTWRVMIDSSNGTATLGKDGCNSGNNAGPFRACDVATVATTACLK